LFEMRILLVALVVLFASCALADEEVAARKSGEEKLGRLLERSRDRPFIMSNTPDFRKFVAEPPRPYDLVLFLTSKTGSCQMCSEIRPEIELVAEAFEKARYANSSESPLHTTFFIELDGSRNYELFTEMGLQTVPHVIFLERTASTKRKKWERLLADRISFNRGWAAENLIKSLGSRVDVAGVQFERPPKPIDWSFLILLVSATVSFVVFFATVGRPYIDTVLRNRKIYLGLSLVGYAFCVAGGMYNHIQNTPFNGQNQDGSVQLISPGNGSQFGVETLIMGFLYLVSAVCIILLNTRAAKAEASVYSRAIVILGLLFCFHFFFRNIREIYSRKNGGYRMGYLWSAPADFW